MLIRTKFTCHCQHWN